MGSSPSCSNCKCSCSHDKLEAETRAGELLGFPADEASTILAHLPPLLPGVVAASASRAGCDADNACSGGHANAIGKGRRARCEDSFHVKLDKTDGGQLGIDVGYMETLEVLPITSIHGGLAEQWNRGNPDKQMLKGHVIIEVNGVRGSASSMLEKCRKEKLLILKLREALAHDHVFDDFEMLIATKRFGSICC